MTQKTEKVHPCNLLLLRNLIHSSIGVAAMHGSWIPAVTMHCEQFEDLFVLECSGKTRKLKESYLTPTCIGKVFNLFPDSIILIAADDGTIEVPDELGFFSGLKTYRTYEVQGESMEMKTVLEKGGECSSSFGSPAVHSHTSKMSSSAGPSRAAEAVCLPVENVNHHRGLRRRLVVTSTKDHYCVTV